MQLEVDRFTAAVHLLVDSSGGPLESFEPEPADPKAKGKGKEEKPAEKLGEKSVEKPAGSGVSRIIVPVDVASACFDSKMKAEKVAPVAKKVCL